MYFMVEFTQSHLFVLPNTLLFNLPLPLTPIYSIVQFPESHLFAITNILLSVKYRFHPPLYTLLYSSLRHKCLLYQTLWSLYSNVLILPYIMCCTVHSVTTLWRTKYSALLQNRSHSPLYTVFYSWLRHKSLPLQKNCSLYSTALTLPYIQYCTFHTVKNFCRTKNSVLYTVPLSLSPIYCNLHFTQSIHFAVPNTLFSVKYRSHFPLIVYCTVHSVTQLCLSKHNIL
jgi:hypothetical protein